MDGQWSEQRVNDGTISHIERRSGALLGQAAFTYAGCSDWALVDSGSMCYFIILTIKLIDS